MEHTKAPEFDPARPLRSGLAVTRAVLLSPKSFYANFSTSGPLKEPILFVLFVSAVSAVLRLAIVFIFSTGSVGEAAISLLEALAFVALSPGIIAALAAVYLLSIRAFVKREADFQEAYRMLAYAYAAMILFWVPIIQAFAFTYAFLVLMMLGVRSVYGTSTTTALVTTFVGYVPAGILFVFLQLAVTGLAFGPAAR